MLLTLPAEMRQEVLLYIACPSTMRQLGLTCKSLATTINSPAFVKAWLVAHFKLCSTRVDLLESLIRCKHLLLQHDSHLLPAALRAVSPLLVGECVRMLVYKDKIDPRLSTERLPAFIAAFHCKNGRYPNVLYGNHPTPRNSYEKLLPCILHHCLHDGARFDFAPEDNVMFFVHVWLLSPVYDVPTLRSLYARLFPAGDDYLRGMLHGMLEAFFVRGHGDRKVDLSKIDPMRLMFLVDMVDRIEPHEWELYGWIPVWHHGPTRFNMLLLNHYADNMVFYDYLYTNIQSRKLRRLFLPATEYVVDHFRNMDAYAPDGAYFDHVVAKYPAFCKAITGFRERLAYDMV